MLKLIIAKWPTFESSPDIYNVSLPDLTTIFNEIPQASKSRPAFFDLVCCLVERNGHDFCGLFTFCPSDKLDKHQMQRMLDLVQYDEIPPNVFQALSNRLYCDVDPSSEISDDPPQLPPESPPTVGRFHPTPIPSPAPGPPRGFMPQSVTVSPSGMPYRVESQPLQTPGPVLQQGIEHQPAPVPASGASQQFKPQPINVSASEARQGFEPPAMSDLAPKRVEQASIPIPVSETQHRFELTPIIDDDDDDDDGESFSILPEAKSPSGSPKGSPRKPEPGSLRAGRAGTPRLPRHLRKKQTPT
jgi:hypothetical protein